jgi:hypothetical protein
MMYVTEQVTVSRTINGWYFPPSAERALDHFSTARAARMGNDHRAAIHWHSCA